MNPWVYGLNPINWKTIKIDCKTQETDHIGFWKPEIAHFRFGSKTDPCTSIPLRLYLRRSFTLSPFWIFSQHLSWFFKIESWSIFTWYCTFTVLNTSKSLQLVPFSGLSLLLIELNLVNLLFFSCHLLLNASVLRYGLFFNKEWNFCSTYSQIFFCFIPFCLILFFDVAHHAYSNVISIYAFHHCRVSWASLVFPFVFTFPFPFLLPSTWVSTINSTDGCVGGGC